MFPLLSAFRQRFPSSSHSTICSGQGEVESVSQCPGTEGQQNMEAGDNTELEESISSQLFEGSSTGFRHWQSDLLDLLCLGQWWFLTDGK